MIDVSSSLGSLVLFAGVLGLVIAVYLQFLGKEAPVSYALGYYLLGAGILFVLAQVSFDYPHGVIIGGVLLVVASELISAYTVIKTHEIQPPWSVLKTLLKEHT